MTCRIVCVLARHRVIAPISHRSEPTSLRAADRDAARVLARMHIRTTHSLRSSFLSFSPFLFYNSIPSLVTKSSHRLRYVLLRKVSFACPTRTGLTLVRASGPVSCPCGAADSGKKILFFFLHVRDWPFRVIPLLVPIPSYNFVTNFVLDGTT